MNYPRALSDHLMEREYRPETVAYIGRCCRVGQMSEQAVLELLEVVEADRLANQCEDQGLRPDTAWDGDMLAARRAIKATTPSTSA